MSNAGNSYLPTGMDQSGRYGSARRPSGWRVPAFSSRNAWSRTDSSSDLPIQQTIRPENNSRSQTSEEEEEILKYLTKEVYNPIPKSLLLRNLTLYYRNKNKYQENSRNIQDLEDEDQKRCTVCLEDFEPKETVMITPCKHMFHEECIVPWLKSKGQCPVCRFIILKPAKQESSSPALAADLAAGDFTVNDLFTLELISVVRAMEESFLFGYPRRL